MGSGNAATPQVPPAGFQTPEGRSCETAARAAGIACLGSPILAAGAAQLQGITAMVGVMAGASNACSKIAEGMDIAQKILTAYNAACGGAMMYCNSTCSVEPVPKYTFDTGPAADTPQMKAKLVNCQGYTANLAAAAGGLVSSLLQQKQASKCEDSLNNCQKNPGAPECQKVVNCSDPADSGSTVCICQNNPRSPGCPGSGDQTDSASATAVAANSSGGAAAKSGASAKLSGQGFASTGGKYGAGGGSGNSMAAASGSAGSSVGGDGEVGKGKGIDGSKSKLSADIIADYGMGGGGGRRGGGSGSGSGGIDFATKYGAYLPGQTKDPARNIASANAVAAQITGSGGKSNFDKVKRAYLNNRNHLLER
jgi:hypothetical protein